MTIEKFGMVDYQSQLSYARGFLEGTFFPRDGIIPQIIDFIKRNKKAFLTEYIQEDNDEGVKQILDLFPRLSLKTLCGLIDDVSEKGKTSLSAAFRRSFRFFLPQPSFLFMTFFTVMISLASYS